MAHRTHRRQHKKLMRLRELEKARYPLIIVRMVEIHNKLREDMAMILEAVNQSAYGALLPAGCTIEFVRPSRKLKRESGD